MSCGALSAERLALIQRRGQSPSSMHLFLQAHSHKWNTKEELGKDKHETPTRQRLLVVVGTEIFTIATPARGVVIFIRVNLATRPPTITTDVSVDLAKHGALAS